jgi:catechol 2,3-dioxygenase-like lactoylglutathione lyase family enzyme
MTISAVYTHTNLIARDWRRLADFYTRAFGCEIVPPERDLQGDALVKGTGVPHAHITGAHLRLPGHGNNGPTIEIFSYNQLSDEGQKRVNRPGWSHIAFRVEDVPAAVEIVKSLGGALLGEVVTTRVGTDKSITWCYMADPEGNIVELQTAIR